MGKSPDKIPAARGFERDFTLLDGMGSYWDMTNMTALVPNSLFTEDGKYLTKLPKHYYATKTYTDKLISFIDANHGGGKPFFAYVSHQAPHDPYHLPRDWCDRHVGQYDIGWDSVREQRLKREKELGIVSDSTGLAERMWYVPDYSLLAPATKALLGRKMELYAGLMENMDFHIGRLIDHLKEIGEFDNTVFIVFGDNGAEGNDLGDSTLSNVGIGGTIGYQINDNLMLNISYSSTVNDNNSEDLKMDGFRVTLLYGWQAMVEGMKRLKEHE